MTEMVREEIATLTAQVDGQGDALKVIASHTHLMYCTVHAAAEQTPSSPDSDFILNAEC